VLNCLISKEPLDGVDAHRLVEFASIARVLARVIAHAAVHGWHRVVADEDLPCLFVTTGLRFREPRLDVFASRAALIARRQAIRVDRPKRAEQRLSSIAIDLRAHSGGSSRTSEESVRTRIEQGARQSARASAAGGDVHV
jgi:hypothetical protein